MIPLCRTDRQKNISIQNIVWKTTTIEHITDVTSRALIVSDDQIITIHWENVVVSFIV
jgi:hypothetical protein